MGDVLYTPPALTDAQQAICGIHLIGLSKKGFAHLSPHSAVDRVIFVALFAVGAKARLSAPIKAERTAFIGGMRIPIRRCD